MKKMVFIAHPISGDVRANVEKVLRICAETHTKNVIPVAPYIVSLQYLDDSVASDRTLGIEANHEYFHRGFIDELWLFGDHISSGMWEEIDLARKLGIPIIAMTPGTVRDLV